MIAENTHCSITMQHIASLTCTGVLCRTQTGRPPHTKHRISSLRKQRAASFTQGQQCSGDQAGDCHTNADSVQIPGTSKRTHAAPFIQPANHRHLFSLHSIRSSC